MTRTKILSIVLLAVACTGRTQAAEQTEQKVLELARGEWIDRRENTCLIGSAGTGITHVASSLGLAACRQGRRVRFFTAARLVTLLEEEQKQYQLDRFLTTQDKDDRVLAASA